MNNIDAQTIIGELVAKDYRTAAVFKKFGIDFCCNGNRTIEEACLQKNINNDTVVQALQALNNANEQPTNDYNSWPLDLLADYIEKKHHRYVEQRIQDILPFLHKVAKVHGGHHPELIEIEQLFNESVAELTTHMKKEELILFPYIRKMATAKQDEQPVSAPFGTVQNPIQMMMHEHNTEGERFRKIAELSNNYNPPFDACNTYKVTFAMLKEFEEDLHLHIHLENNILFPKAIEMEKAVAMV